MLLIYTAMYLGGVETFFLRLAKERYRLGKRTKILLMSDSLVGDLDLLKELKQYAEVVYVKDIVNCYNKITASLLLLLPKRKHELDDLLKGIEQIHVCYGSHALFAYSLIADLNEKPAISIGFYHYLNFLWGGSKIPYCEKVHRRFIFDFLSRQSLVMFSEDNRRLHSKITGKKFDGAQTFPIGVITKVRNVTRKSRAETLLIGTVGRLERFKSYHLHMINVICSLRKQGYSVKYVIYGTGSLERDLRNMINRLSLTEVVELRGKLPYDSLEEKLEELDLFVGTGTALTTAGAIGIPAIVCAENNNAAVSVGFISQVASRQYTRELEDLPLVDIEDLIVQFLHATDNEVYNIRMEHVNKMKKFTTQICNNNMESLKYIGLPPKRFKFNIIRYILSMIFDKIHYRINSKHPWRTRFLDFQ